MSSSKRMLSGFPDARIQKTRRTSADEVRRPRGHETGVQQMETSQTILGYALRTKISGGGIGDVYQGIHPTSGQQVAIRVLNPMLASSLDVRNRVAQQIRLQANLQHPNIVRALAVEFSEEVAVIVMEHVHGFSLDRVIAHHGALSVENARWTIEQILTAVGHGHEKGIVHHDLKPSTVLVQSDGVVKVADFGIVEAIRDARVAHAETVVSSPAYLSPEKILGETNIDHRTDVYSLGVTFYELLTGQAPFGGGCVPGERSDSEIKEGHIRQRPQDPRVLRTDLHEYVAWWLLKALEKNRDDRFQSVPEMFQALHHCLAATPPTGDTSSPAATPLPAVEATPEATQPVGRTSVPVEGELSFDKSVRLAIAICSDLVLYNEQSIAELRSGNASIDILEAEIREGRQHFLTRRGIPEVFERVLEVLLIHGQRVNADTDPVLRALKGSA